MQNFLKHTLSVRSLVDFSFSSTYRKEDKNGSEESGAQFTLSI